MRTRIITMVSGLAVLALALTGLSAKADSEHPGFISRPAEAADLKGDNNGIGLFHRNEANKKLVKVFGKITAISDTSITILSKRNLENSSSVHTATSYTFTIDSTTKILRRFRATALVGELTVGDQVRVWGTKLTDGTAKLIWDSSIWWIRLNGTISNLNATDKTFDLIITRKSQNDTPKTFTVAVKTNDATMFVKADGTAGTWTDLTNGATVRIRGVWNHVGRYLTARNIKLTE